MYTRFDLHAFAHKPLRMYLLLPLCYRTLAYRYLSDDFINHLKDIDSLLIVRPNSYSVSSADMVPTTTQLVGLGGLEPPTSPLSGVRSNQLSYKPFRFLTIIFSH